MLYEFKQNQINQLVEILDFISKPERDDILQDIRDAGFVYRLGDWGHEFSNIWLRIYRRDTIKSCPYEYLVDLTIGSYVEWIVIASLPALLEFLQKTLPLVELTGKIEEQVERAEREYLKIRDREGNERKRQKELSRKD